MPRMVLRSLIAFVLALCSVAALAQPVTRNIPKDAKAGQLTHLQENVFSLDGQKVRLAAGGTIRGENDLLITPMTVKRDSIVRYTVDADGNLDKVWVLTPEEAKNVNIGWRMPWSTSPEIGRPINQVLPQSTGTQPQSGGSPTR